MTDRKISSYICEKASKSSPKESVFYTIGSIKDYKQALKNDKHLIIGGKKDDYPGTAVFESDITAVAYIKSGKAECDFELLGKKLGKRDFEVFRVWGVWESDTYGNIGCRRLLKNKAAINRVVGIHYERDKTPYEVDPQTELFMSCKEGCLPYVEELIEAGLNADNRNSYALQVAAAEGHLEIVEYLVEHGADVVANKPARAALFKGHIHVADYLLKNGATLGKIEWGQVRDTDDVDVVKFLLKNNYIDEAMLSRWWDLQDALAIRTEHFKSSYECPVCKFKSVNTINRVGAV